ncbi:hypothetical protein KEG38_00745 [Polyangium jinanense]|uniref:hypothetical protein n=1 Tax=Polyangium jinanense TaxID=2829994 RepID=UPI00234155D3|nr:hypothetical protein [Polyangium jinanense]MDC3952354.1 hypothetical protein [Polyangium jinanense]
MAYRAAALAAALLALALPRAAAAEPAPKIAFRLDLQALPGRGCPTAEEFGLILAAEFGYLLVRDDARATLRIETHPNGNKLDAVITVPDPESNGEWRRVLTQGDCRELLYDVAVLVSIAFGPRAWRGSEPPPWLVAPVDFEVGRPVLDFEPSSAIVKLLHPVEEEAYEPVVVVSKEPLPRPIEDKPPFKVEAALGPAVMLHGLPGVAVGGNGLLGLRWRRFAVAAELRGLITPASGIGDHELPGRASVWAASALPCYAFEHIDACGAATFSHLSIDVESPLALTQADGFSVGFGARINGRVRLSERLGLLGFFDLNVQSRTFVLKLDASRTVADWRSPLLRLAVGAAVVIHLSE